MENKTAKTDSKNRLIRADGVKKIMNDTNLDTAASPKNGWKLTEENFTHSILQFRDRQAGVSVVYDLELDRYTYNAYCIEAQLLQELFTCEYEFLEDALLVVNEEFGQWESIDLSAKTGCGSCVAKGVH
jgi:hypothetical protein